MLTRPTVSAEPRRCPTRPARWARIAVWAACAGVLLAAATRGHGRAAASDEPTPAPDAQPIDLGPTLARSCHQHKIPAMAGAGVKGGTLWGVGAAGVRQTGKDARVALDDQWYIGSCGRAMTATLAAVLVEKGTISWDSTVADVLPKVAEVAREEYRTTTLAQLLQGRSGLPKDPGADSPIWTLIRGAEGTPPEQRLTIAKIALRQQPIRSKRSHDSTLAYVVAGAMLEAAAGAPFEDLMRRSLFDPLAMRSAGFGPPGAPGALDQPVGHTPGFGGWLRPASPKDSSYLPPAMDPAGNVHCSIADWAKFATLTLRGARGDTGLLISPESFRVIQTDMARRNRDPMGWELGARTWAGGAVLIHQEQGAWYAIIYVAPKADAAYLVTANRGDKDAELAAEEVLNAMVSQDLANAE